MSPRASKLEYYKISMFCDYVNREWFTDGHIFFLMNIFISVKGKYFRLIDNDTEILCCIALVMMASILKNKLEVFFFHDDFKKNVLSN